MFDDIGGKIKGLAVILCVLGIILSVILGIVCWTLPTGYRYSNPMAGFWPGLAVIVGGCLGSWIGSFFMYGFGQLIEDTQESRALLYQMSLDQGRQGSKHTADDRPISTPVPDVPVNRSGSEWRCSKCGHKNGSLDQFCKDCGTYR